MSPSFDLPSPARATVGAIGPPGKRIFYFQARQEDRLVSLKLEKEQVLFLAGGLTEVLADLAAPGGVPSGSELDLEEPVEADWAVGSMQLAYDAGRDRVVLVAREVVAEEEEPGAGEGGESEGLEALGLGEADIAALAAAEAPGAGVARFMLTREQAAGLIERGKELLRGGRPPCPLCGYPLSEDHSCPKTNGHRAPSL